MFDLAVSTIAQGLMWSILSLGVFLSFRVLDVPDMTCEGSFPLGGAIAATLITAGVSRGLLWQPVPLAACWPALFRASCIPS